MGHFLRGVETVKRFVNIRLSVDVVLPRENFYGRPWLLSPFQQASYYRTEDETNLHIVLFIYIVYS